MHRVAIIAGIAVVIIVAALAFVHARRERPYDPDFATGVTALTFTGREPVVLYDEGHHNGHEAAGAYRPFCDLARDLGCEVRVSRGPITAAALEGIAVLAVVCARGADDANDDDAFTAAEAAAIEAWVRGRGSLLLVTDHWPYGPAAASLAGRFGVAMGGGLVEDPAHHDPERGASHLVFTTADATLGDHPLLRGRRADERVGRVLSFTGQSLAGPPEAIPLLVLSATAVEYPPTTPRVERHGDDVTVSMEYGEAVPAAGRAQGLALEPGAGRVVVLGEAGMLRAQRERDGTRVGMNVPGYDNRQLAINILHWLARAEGM